MKMKTVEEDKGAAPRKMGKPMNRFDGFYQLMKIAFKALFSKKPFHIVSVGLAHAELNAEKTGLDIELCGFNAGNPYKILSVLNGMVHSHKEDMKKMGLHVCTDDGCVLDALGGKAERYVGAIPPGMPPEVAEALQNVLGIKFGEPPTKH